MKTEKKSNPFSKILFLLFLIYCGLFIAKETGYYDKSIREKVIFTQNKINDFEKDIAEGKEVNVISYLPKEEDYSNIYTKTANVVSNKLSTIFSSKVKNVWDFIRALFIS